MAISQAKAGYGTLLKVGNGASPEVFTTVAEMDAVKPPGDTTDVIEVTNHDSPGGYKEYIPTLLDTSPVTQTANYINNTQQNLIQTNLRAKTITNFQIVLTTGSPRTCSFSAIIVKWDVDPPIKSQIKLSFELRGTSQPVWS